MINDSVKTVAIAISAKVYNNLHGVGAVGGIIGMILFFLRNLNGLKF